MTAITAQELIDFIANDGAGINYTYPGESETKTLLGWAQAGSFPHVRGALFDVSLWPNQFSVAVASVPRSEVWRTLANAVTLADISPDVKDDIDRILDGQQDFPIGTASAYDAMLAAIPDSSAYQPLRAAFSGMAERPASFGESHEVTDDVINQAIASFVMV